MDWSHALSAVLVLWLLMEFVQVFRVRRALRRRQMLLPVFGLFGRLSRIANQRILRQRRGRKRLLDTLKAFREVAAALPDALLVLDRENRVLWFNSNATRFLGLQKPTQLERPLFEKLRVPQAEEWLASGRIHEPLLDVASPVDPSLRLSWRHVPFRRELSLLVVRDISNLMRLEQVRRDFVANVSHELRTPLTVINGYLDAFDPEELADFAPMFTQMRSQSQRMVQIVEDLLTLSRLDAQDPATDEYMLMAPLLQQLQADAAGLSRGQHEIILIDELAMDLVGNAKDLRSAFSNLVSNAVRYTAAGGNILLRWSWHEDGAAFCVQDSGYGIPAQHLPRLTERFYRVSSSRSRDSGGTGLGLAIVNHVLIAHQAKLGVESTVGVGSKFCCVFPRERLRYRDAGI